MMKFELVSISSEWESSESQSGQTSPKYLSAINVFASRKFQFYEYWKVLHSYTSLKRMEFYHNLWKEKNIWQAINYNWRLNKFEFCLQKYTSGLSFDQWDTKE